MCGAPVSLDARSMPYPVPSRIRETWSMPSRVPIVTTRSPPSSTKSGVGDGIVVPSRSTATIEAPVREVEVHRLELIARDGPRLSLRVECGSGTYVRGLVRDLGEALGCGAHVTGLRDLRAHRWLAWHDAPRTLETRARVVAADATGTAVRVELHDLGDGTGPPAPAVA